MMDSEAEFEKWFRGWKMRIGAPKMNENLETTLDSAAKAGWDASRKRILDELGNFIDSIKQSQGT